MPFAAFYFFFYLTSGVIVPYFAQFCFQLGLSATQIGIILAGRVALGAVAQLGWAYAADRRGRVLGIMRLLCFTSLLSIVTLPYADSFLTIALPIWLHAVFSSSRPALIDSIVLIKIGSRDFGNSRLWGSIGFGIGALVFGLVLNDHPGNGILLGLPLIWLALESMTFLASFRLPETGRKSSGVTFGGLAALVNDPVLWLLLLGACIHWMTNIPYNFYFTTHCSNLFGTKELAGMGIAVGIVGEVIGLRISSRVIGRFGIKTVLAFSALVTTVRWLLMYLAMPAWLLITLQLAHLATFGLWYSATVAYLTERIPEKWRASGQTLLMLVAFNLGGTAASLGSGYLLDIYNSTFLLYLVAGFFALLALPAFLLLPAKPGTRTFD
jgi:MFS transporter, PPP family, 3-phenylpropionic acid transporter